jgi:hypothetical protein
MQHHRYQFILLFMASIVFSQTVSQAVVYGNTMNKSILAKSPGLSAAAKITLQNIYALNGVKPSDSINGQKEQANLIEPQAPDIEGLLSQANRVTATLGHQHLIYRALAYLQAIRSEILAVRQTNTFKELAPARPDAASSSPERELLQMGLQLQRQLKNQQSLKQLKISINELLQQIGAFYTADHNRQGIDTQLLSRVKDQLDCHDLNFSLCRLPSPIDQRTAPARLHEEQRLANLLVLAQQLKAHRQALSQRSGDGFRREYRSMGVLSSEGEQGQAEDLLVRKYRQLLTTPGELDSPSVNQLIATASLPIYLSGLPNMKPWRKQIDQISSMEAYSSYRQYGSSQLTTCAELKWQTNQLQELTDMIQGLKIDFAKLMASYRDTGNSQLLREAGDLIDDIAALNDQRMELGYIDQSTPDRLRVAQWQLPVADQPDRLDDSPAPSGKALTKVSQARLVWLQIGETIWTENMPFAPTTIMPLLDTLIIDGIPRSWSQIQYVTNHSNIELRWRQSPRTACIDRQSVRMIFVLSTHESVPYLVLTRSI